MDVPFYLAQAEYAGVTDPDRRGHPQRATSRSCPSRRRPGAVVNKALNLVRCSACQCRQAVAVFFWNYPPGEKNLSASFMNLPRSLVGTLSRAAGRRLPHRGAWTRPLTARCSACWRPSTAGRPAVPALLRDGLAERLPVAAYRPGCRPPCRPRCAGRTAARWGEPERQRWCCDASWRRGEPFFVIPRLQLGQVTLLPQPAARRALGRQGKGAVPLHHRRCPRTSTSRLPVGAQATGAMPWCTTAPTARRNGCRARSAACRCTTTRCSRWATCRWSTPTSSTTSARPAGQAPRPRHHRQPPDAALRPGRPARRADAHPRPAARLAGAGRRRGEGADPRRPPGRRAKERIDRDMGWTPSARIAADFPASSTRCTTTCTSWPQTAQPLGLHTFGPRRSETSTASPPCC
jgi:cobaltochelatase CobN